MIPASINTETDSFPTEDIVIAATNCVFKQFLQGIILYNHPLTLEVGFRKASCFEETLTVPMKKPHFSLISLCLSFKKVNIS